MDDSQKWIMSKTHKISGHLNKKGDKTTPATLVYCCIAIAIAIAIGIGISIAIVRVRVGVIKQPPANSSKSRRRSPP